MTFREYKNAGGTWDKKEFANDADSFGHKGDTIYGDTPSMNDWEVWGVRFEGKTKILILRFPH